MTTGLRFRDGSCAHGVDVFVVDRRDPHANDRSPLRRLAGDQLDGRRIDARQRGEIGPLLVIGVRTKLVVEENRVSLRSGPVLQRQRDEVSESTARHRVLARKEPIVGFHAELVPPRHGLGDQVAAHLARGSRRHR